MKTRLLFVLLPAALAATMVGLTMPASAELRDVTVRLADGSLATVTVDVPPGTPLEDIQLPAPPAVPTVPLPVPTPPGTPAPDPGSGTPDQGTAPDQSQPADSPPSASDQKSAAQKKSGDKQKAKPNALGDAPNAQPQDEVQKKLDKINQHLRNPDGSPAPTNPTYFDALPGPAVASGVPNFVIQKFRVPIFLLPIYQAAGIQYGIRWEILAAINEIETDY
ncbi:MAG: hypothetical protein QOI98_559, partial [Solirubrobacteraceae bacterium]|nr:hypothetical protein [Solirubrobacteraceae bacterium]